MPICKFCGAVINELFRRCSGVEESRFYINDDYAGIEGETFESDGNVELYVCPECNEELFSGWDEAEQFLKDKDDLQELVAEKINKIKEDKNGKCY